MEETPAAPPKDAQDTAKPGPGLTDRLQVALRFLVQVGERFMADECQMRAAALTFNALLATVPLVAVSFAIFSAFPAFARMQGEVQMFIFQNFVPEIGEVVQTYVQDFATKTGELTIIGVLFLIVTSIMLLSTISRAFNAVWRVKPRRALAVRMLVFWAALTLGPLLFGASLTLSSYLFAMTREAGGTTLSGPLAALASLAPLILQVAGFSLLYAVLPDFPVRRRDAVTGGLVAGILFEMLKKGFGYYVASVPTYQTIYGALATFPIFLIWVYLSWLVVMLGAEIAAVLPEWRAGAGRRDAPDGNEATPRLAAALAVLNVLALAGRDGRMVRPSKLVEMARIGPSRLSELTEALQRKGYITRAEKGAWIILRDLNQVSLHQLVSDLGLRLSAEISPEQFRSNWGPRYAQIAAGLNSEAKARMDLPLAQLFAPRDGAEALPDRDAFLSDEDITKDAAQSDTRRSMRIRLLGMLGLGWLISNG